MSKSKASGRSRRSGPKERFWREVIADRQHSGESIRAFCQNRQLNESSFYRWQKEVRLRDASGNRNATRNGQQEASHGPTPSVPPLLAPVVVVDGPSDDCATKPLVSPEPSASIEIVLASGYTVRVPASTTHEQLGMVLAVLESARC